MKKRIGELNGKPIVIGDSNLITMNEYYCTLNNGVINIMKRASNGLLVSITELPSASLFSIDELDNNILESETEQQIKNILSE